MEMQIANLQNQLKNFPQNVEEVQAMAEVEKLRQANEVSRMDIEKGLMEISRLKKDGELRTTRLQHLEQELREATSMLTTSREETDRVKGELECCRRAKSQVEIDLASLKSQQRSLNQELQEVMAAKQVSDLRLADEKQHKKQLASNHERLSSKLSIIKGELAALKEGEEQRWQERKASFLQSSEYYELLGGMVSTKPTNSLYAQASYLKELT